MRRALLLALLLPACQKDAGPAPDTGEQPTVDVDGDGYPAEVDCDDDDPEVHPEAQERCDGVDEDCDASIDEGAGEVWYADADADGHGDPDAELVACEQPSGAVGQADDCDDTDPAVHPGADERCDGVDEDCDEAIDEGARDASTWYADADSDGYGDPSAPVEGCEQPSGAVDRADDCDDTDPAVHPGASDPAGDGVDQDCDGLDACTDLDCDGAADLLVPVYYDGSTYASVCYLYFNAQGFAEADRQQLPCGSPHHALAEDLDADGFIDIVFANGNTSEATWDSYVYWGSGQGYSLDDRSELYAARATGVLAEDLDGDGHVDLVFSSLGVSSTDDDSFVYLGSAQGFDEADRVALPTLAAREPAAADFDGDGYTDLLFCNNDSDSEDDPDAFIYWGSAAGFDPAALTALPTPGCEDVLVQDLDGDGDVDVVIANAADDRSDYAVSSRVLFNEGGDFTEVTELHTEGAVSVVAGDLDGDGDVDLAFAGYYAGSWGDPAQVQVYWQDAGGYSADAVTELGDKGTGLLSVADLDLDGYPELLVPLYYNGLEAPDSLVYWGSAQGYSEADVTALESNGPRTITAGDLNGDGYPEVILNNHRGPSRDSRIYYGPGLGTWTDLDTLGTLGAAVIVGG